MRALEPWHIILLVVVLLLLFGSKRLPDAARGLGRSLRIFKSEVKDLTDDDAPATPDVAARPAAPVAPQQITAGQPTLAPGDVGVRDAAPSTRE